MGPGAGSPTSEGLHIPYLGFVDGVGGSLLVEWLGYILHLKAALAVVDSREPQAIVKMLKYLVR